jgi:hypothetical protein
VVALRSLQYIYFTQLRIGTPNRSLIRTACKNVGSRFRCSRYDTCDAGMPVSSAASFFLMLRLAIASAKSVGPLFGPRAGGVFCRRLAMPPKYNSHAAGVNANFLA